MSDKEHKKITTKDILDSIVPESLLPKSLKSNQSKFEDSFKDSSIDRETKYIHLSGLRDHYKQKENWSVFLMTTMAFMVLFQSVLLILVGSGVLDFTKYEWLLPLLLVQNLGQIIGLAIFVVKSLYRH